LICTEYSVKHKRTAGLLAGVLLLLYACPAPAQTRATAPTNGLNTTLATRLFEESAWQPCRIECERILLHQEQKNDLQSGLERIKLMRAVCGLRLGRKDAQTDLCRLAEQSNTKLPPDVRAMAGYELGRTLWLQGRSAEAIPILEKALNNAESNSLYNHIAATTYLLLRENRDLAGRHTVLDNILATTRPTWKAELFAECARPPSKEHKSLAAAPARWTIRFYQAQIGPAIGARCSLTPSCSHYAQQALHRHGIKGIGLIGDRLVREPGVVAAGEKPVIMHGKIRFSDPLSDHDRLLSDKKTGN